MGVEEFVGTGRAMSPAVIGHVGVAGGLGALAWVALKVGALSYGGGFVIVPLMQHDVVSTYHWMSGTQFLSAVALGQLTRARSSRRSPRWATSPMELAGDCSRR